MHTYQEVENLVRLATKHVEGDYEAMLPTEMLDILSTIQTLENTVRSRMRKQLEAFANNGHI